MGRVSSFKEVTPLGLMRTPPPGTQFKTSGVSGPSLPTSPTKDGLESPAEFPLKKIVTSGPSLPASPIKEAVPESPSAFHLKKSSVSGASIIGSPEGKLKESVPESPSGLPFKTSSISGSSLHRNSVTEPPAEFPLKKSSISGASVARSPEAKTKETAPDSPGFPFKTSSISGSPIHRNSVTEPPAEFPFKRPSTAGSSIHRSSITESPAEFPFKRPSIAGSSIHRNSVSESPAEFPFKKPSIAGSSIHRNSITESPAEFPFKKPSVSGPSLPRNSISERPVEFPLKRPSTSGSSVSAGLVQETVPETSSEFPFRKPSVSGASVPGTPEGKSKEMVQESPSILGSPDAGFTKEEPPTYPLHAEEDPETVPHNALAEEARSDSPVPKEDASQEPQTPIESEVTPEPQSTPTPRAPPDSLSPKPNFSISTSSRGPIPPKAKTAQSPVIDFRANLRKREVVKDIGNEQEPEFKNVFGRLKKAETRNYVAPDELKGNILRGKAALNNTGGPKKTERVDEFRKSLVLRKDEMKAGGGSIRRNTAGEMDAPKPAEALPEAIAMRQNMTRANSIKQDPVDEPTSPAKSLGSRASLDRPPLSSPSSSFRDNGSSRTSQEQQPSSPFRADDVPGWPLKDTVAPEAPQETEPFSPLSVDRFVDEDKEEAVPATSEFQKTSREESSVSQEEPREDAEAIEPSVAKINEPPVKTARPVRAWPPAPVDEATVTPNLPVKSKLAGRINPALVGLLSRGPPAPEESKKQLPSSFSTQSETPSPSAPLTHVTKGRARGPKRRLPQTTNVLSPSPRDDTKEVGAISYSEATPLQTPPSPVESSGTNSDLQLDDNSVPDTEESCSGSPVTEQHPEVNIPSQDTLDRDTPQSKFPEALQTRSLTTDFEIFPSPNLEATPRDPESPGEVSPSSGPPVPPKSDSPTTSSPATPKAKWSQQNWFGSSSPSPLRTSLKENQMESPISQQKSIPGVTIDSARSSVSRPMSQPSPPVPPKDVDTMLHKPTDPRRLSRKMPAPSLVAQASEARDVIGGFFKTFPNPRDRMDIDPQLILMRESDDVKIRTVKRQIWELTGDGRRQELPSHQEYILYQGSMYLCVHTFESGRSSASDVYLWRGDDVPDYSVDDEQPFARKVARDNSSKLQIIRQGKEPKRYIQALGGIMITRRGSSSRHNSSALYMLCGRKHLGEMTFDEVDYSLRNLCSGFPYVVSAPFGKLYLWKGKGSGPEETGAARLIGMDLGLTGEFEEVSEGTEPEEFFDVFAGPREAAPHMCQDHWQLKPKYNHYRTRLLRVDHDLSQPTRFWNIRRPGSGSPVVKPNDCIQEIEPFCYRDLTEKDVYVLDTFFEIYV